MQNPEGSAKSALDLGQRYVWLKLSTSDIQENTVNILLFPPLRLGNKRTLHFGPHLHYRLVPCIWCSLSFWYFFNQLTLERDLNYMGPLILGIFSTVSTYSAT